MSRRRNPQQPRRSFDRASISVREGDDVFARGYIDVVRVDGFPPPQLTARELQQLAGQVRPTMPCHICGSKVPGVGHATCNSCLHRMSQLAANGLPVVIERKDAIDVS